MSTTETKHLTLKINRTLHDLMRELASRRRTFVSALYDEAIELFLNQDENYMGENFKVPDISASRATTRCTYRNQGSQCYLLNGHNGKHKVQGVNV